MPVAVVDICNLALIKLGSDTIVDLSDDNRPARFCNELYGPTRDEVLRDPLTDWNFATFRQALTQDADDPIGRFDYQYTLPVDPFCLRVLNMIVDLPDPQIRTDTGDVTQPEYVIEGRKLLTDEDSASIRYIGIPPDTADFDPLFVKALAARLASELALALTQDSQMWQVMRQEYALIVARAVSGDRREQSSNPQEEPENWAGVARGTNASGVVHKVKVS